MTATPTTPFCKTRLANNPANHGPHPDPSIGRLVECRGAMVDIVYALRASHAVNLHEYRAAAAAEIDRLRAEVARLTAALDKGNACIGTMLASQFKGERAALVARQSRSALRGV